MAKLYLFAVGGTGTRVLKSLTMLLASGVHINVDEIVPMIIDTDINNGDLEKYRRIHNEYELINKSCYMDLSKDSFKNHFFRTKIAKPKEISLSGTSFGNLMEMIDYNGLNASGQSETKLLVDLLFSDEVLKMKLEKGFMGNPNIGSIVLKHVIDSQGFKDFTLDFNSGDRIFIVSSIFGGTGAAGFPLLLKLFRSNQSNMNNIGFINNAIIGATTVLPYFEVDVTKFQSGESQTNSDTFITKTKAALTYYDQHVGNLINALYYIGDTLKSNYENNDGGEDQKNPSNFIELAAALSIVDFMKYERAAQNIDELSKPVRYFEFGVDADLETFSFKNLPSDDKLFQHQLSSFAYFSVYMSNFLKNSLYHSNLVWRNELMITPQFANSDFVSALVNFCNKHFYNYLIELAYSKHGRRFIPLKLRFENVNYDKIEELTEPISPLITLDSLFEIINEVPAKRNGSFFKKDAIKFDQIASSLAVNRQEALSGSTELKFMDLFNRTVSQIINERF